MQMRSCMYYYFLPFNSRDGAVGWGTALLEGRSRVRFPMVSLQFFRPHYDPGVHSASNRNEYQQYIFGGIGGRCLGLTLPPSWVNLLERSGHVQSSLGIVLHIIIIIIIIILTNTALRNVTDCPHVVFATNNLSFWKIRKNNKLCTQRCIHIQKTQYYFQTNWILNHSNCWITGRGA